MVTERLVVLDRDGVINHDSAAFIKSPDEWQPIAGSLEAIAALCADGFTIAVATNQSGLGRGLLQPFDLELIHDKMLQQVAAAGGRIDHIVFCPHLPEDGCDCRKPAPGLLLQLAVHYGISMQGVPVIGDSARDLQAAAAVDARPMLVLTGNGRRTAASQRGAGAQVESYADLAAAARQLLDEQRGAAG
ncbi:MAG: D-glycero-beta-D-manno-heptose 1,7-bisphosphate 7-phosphatase [Gammaproteobacteria bacterium]|nr:MAG: D-glycero-beta-D-manno-heptose 1,7-bisphosphate 7-phosphatase [Gammaproteobacteria bacterium]